VKRGGHGVNVSARSLPGIKMLKESSIVVTLTLYWSTGDQEGRAKALEHIVTMMRDLLGDEEYAALVKHLHEEAPA
jgi:hypothetical protein